MNIPHLTAADLPRLLAGPRADPRAVASWLLGHVPDEDMTAVRGAAAGDPALRAVLDDIDAPGAADRYVTLVDAAGSATAAPPAAGEPAFPLAAVGTPSAPPAASGPAPGDLVQLTEFLSELDVRSPQAEAAAAWDHLAGPAAVARFGALYGALVGFAGRLRADAPTAVDQAVLALFPHLVDADDPAAGWRLSYGRFAWRRLVWLVGERGADDGATGRLWRAETPDLAARLAAAVRPAAGGLGYGPDTTGQTKPQPEPEEGRTEKGVAAAASYAGDQPVRSVGVTEVVKEWSKLSDASRAIGATPAALREALGDRVPEYLSRGGIPEVRPTAYVEKVNEIYKTRRVGIRESLRAALHEVAPNVPVRPLTDEDFQAVEAVQFLKRLLEEVRSKGRDDWQWYFIEAALRADVTRPGDLAGFEPWAQAAPVGPAADPTSRGKPRAKWAQAGPAGSRAEWLGRQKLQAKADERGGEEQLTLFRASLARQMEAYLARTVGAVAPR